MAKSADRRGFFLGDLDSKISGRYADVIEIIGDSK